MERVFNQSMLKSRILLAFQVVLIQKAMAMRLSG
jgi:hypothetical protein